MDFIVPKLRMWPIRSIYTKFLISFLVVALIPVCTLGIFSYQQSTRVINSQYGSYGSYAVTQLKLQLDANLKRMEYLADDIVAYLSNSVTRIPDSEPVRYREYKEVFDLKRFLTNYSPNEWGLLITGSGMVYGNEELRMDRVRQEGWWQENISASRGRVWVGFHPATYYGEKRAEDTLISLIAPVDENFNVPKGSKIVVEMDADPIMTLFRSFEQDTGSYLKIIDSRGQYIYESSSDFKPQPDDRVWGDTLDTNGWTIEARMAKQQFFESANVIRQYLLVTAIVSLIIALCCATVFSSSTMKRIQRLSRSMNAAGMGNFSIRNIDPAEDELGMLNRHFNRMIEQIKMLIENISLIEKKKKEADIRVLHYQINPHVLFNTLNSIQWKARLTGQHEIQQMLVHLIAVLEESLRYKEEIVPLRRELEMASHYLAIQRFRFGDAFQYTESIDRQLIDKISIPRMTLQPLFENIFFHAFEDGKGRISLKGSVKGEGTVVLELTDDGKGIAGSKMDRLLQPKPEGSRGGLGLYNVDQKIKLHFGLRYGIAVTSSKHEGTRIEILLPGEGGADHVKEN